MDNTERKVESSAELGAMLGKLMQDPDLMGKVAGVLNGIRGQASVQKTEKESVPEPLMKEVQTEPVSPDLPSSLLSLLGKSAEKSEHHDPSIHRRNALLCALKPYLSETRGRAIDAIIRMDDVAELLKQLPRS